MSERERSMLRTMYYSSKKRSSHEKGYTVRQATEIYIQMKFIGIKSNTMIILLSKTYDYQMEKSSGIGGGGMRRSTFVERDILWIVLDKLKVFNCT